MITEHNYQKIYLLEIDTPHGKRWLGSDGYLWLSGQWIAAAEEEQALTFLGYVDAERFGKKYWKKEFRVVEIVFPYRLEYEMPAIWQKQRVYRTREAAIAGLVDYAGQVQGTWSGDHLWRIVEIATGKVIASMQPDNPDTKLVGDNNIPTPEGCES